MADPTDKMESIINLCKRRGFVFPSSDIYGGFNGFFDDYEAATNCRRLKSWALYEVIRRGKL